MIFMAATLYGVGKTFFWPTTLGVVSEQFPTGGALTLNAIAGVGMIAVGVLGAPFLGTIQDYKLDKRLQAEAPAIHDKVAGTATSAYLMTFRPVDNAKVEALSADEKTRVNDVKTVNSQETLATFAILPAIMFFCYIGLILYFRTQGGYKPVDLVAVTAPARAPAGRR